MPPGFARDRVRCSRGVTSALTRWSIDRRASRRFGGPRRATTTGCSPRSPPPSWRPPRRPRRPTALRPPIVQRPIPFGARRKREMAAYARRHYGLRHLPAARPEGDRRAPDGQRLDRRRPTTRSRPTGPTPSCGELPGTCAHFVVGARRDDRAVRPAVDHVPPHRRPELDGDRHRARRPPRRRRARQRRASCARRSRSRAGCAAARASAYATSSATTRASARATTASASRGCAARRTATGAPSSMRSYRARLRATAVPGQRDLEPRARHEPLTRPMASARRWATRLRMQGRCGPSPRCAATDVMRTSGSPQATIQPNGARSLSTLTAKPCLRHALRDVEADRGDLLRAGPHARSRRRPRRCARGRRRPPRPALGDRAPRAWARSP